VGGSVFNRPIAAILSRSDHYAAAFFLQGVKNYTDVKLVLLYRLILGTYMIFTRKQNFLSPSVYCPDTSKRVPQIVTATETEWRKRFVRDWIETKSRSEPNFQLESQHNLYQSQPILWHLWPFVTKWVGHKKELWPKYVDGHTLCIFFSFFNERYLVTNQLIWSHLVTNQNSGSDKSHFPKEDYVCVLCSQFGTALFPSKLDRPMARSTHIRSIFISKHELIWCHLTLKMRSERGEFPGTEPLRATSYALDS